MDFEKGFGKVHYAPCLLNETNLDITMIIDDASVELFADRGLTVMTEIFFPTAPYNKIILDSKEELTINQLRYVNLQSIWK